MVESIGTETATHNIGADTGSGRQMKNAFEMATVGVLESIVASIVRFYFERLGLNAFYAT